ncbi:MAG TPA: 23S rRNA (uracil(1939)-C(5))-methyltransferase RlmD [Solirubrobacteraceae bacterium]
MQDELLTTAAPTPSRQEEPPSRTRPERGEELELTIDSLAFGGEGVARWGEGGYVVFVAGAIPGDHVRAVVHKRKRSYAHARTVEVLAAGPERIDPLAQHPGVPWQVLPYERQVEIKQDQLAEALRRIGGLEGFLLEETIPARERWRYRNKLEYSFGEDPKTGELLCGFHASGGWKRVEPITDCLLASERGNLARELTLQWCRGQRLGAWDRHRENVGTGTALLRNLVVREGRNAGLLQIRLVTTPGEVDVDSLASVLAAELGAEHLSGVLWTRSTALAETTAGGETDLVWGEEALPERLGELDLRISAEAFFQTNTEMAQELYGLASSYAALQGWERVFDLYCGTGTIALTLAPRAGEVWGIELVEQAVADAIAAAKRNEITNASFFAGDTRLALPELVERAGRPDVVVVDPPRAGLSQKVVRRIIDAAPKRIVYVSCNPTTLAPNAAQLVEAGWRLIKVRGVDMFPQTPHIECVALLERRKH